MIALVLWLQSSSEMRNWLMGFVCCLRLWLLCFVPSQDLLGLAAFFCCLCQNRVFGILGTVSSRLFTYLFQLVECDWYSQFRVSRRFASELCSTTTMSFFSGLKLWAWSGWTLNCSPIIWQFGFELRIRAESWSIILVNLELLISKSDLSSSSRVVVVRHLSDGIFQVSMVDHAFVGWKGGERNCLCCLLYTSPSPRD